MSTPSNGRGRPDGNRTTSQHHVGTASVAERADVQRHPGPAAGRNITLDELFKHLRLCGLLTMEARRRGEPIWPTTTAGRIRTRHRYARLEATSAMTAAQMTFIWWSNR